MIYGHTLPSDAIDQGDIVEECPLTFVDRYDLDDLDQNEIEFVPTRVLVLTQTCDLANQKTSMVTVAVVHDAQFLALFTRPGVTRAGSQEVSSPACPCRIRAFSAILSG